MGEYDVVYDQIDAKVMVPDLERMLERGLVPIVKEEGEVDGDNLILNPDKPRPKLPVILTFYLEYRFWQDGPQRHR